MANKITHKRGDTFELNMTLTNPDTGNPVDITFFTIRSQIRQRDDALVDTLTVTKTVAASGKFQISALASDTADWPVAVLELDVEFIDPSGDVSSTETLFVDLIKDITRVP